MFMIIFTNNISREGKNLCHSVEFGEHKKNKKGKVEKVKKSNFRK